MNRKVNTDKPASHEGTKTQRRSHTKTPRHKDIGEKVEDNLHNDTKGKKKKEEGIEKKIPRKSSEVNRGFEEWAIGYFFP